MVRPEDPAFTRYNLRCCPSTYMHETVSCCRIYAPEAANKVQVTVKDMVGAGTWM